MLRHTGEDSWKEPSAEAQPLASKGRREAGVVFLAGLHDVSSARVRVLLPGLFTNPLCSCRATCLYTNTENNFSSSSNSSSIMKPAMTSAPRQLHRRLRWTGAARAGRARSGGLAPVNRLKDEVLFGCSIMLWIGEERSELACPALASCVCIAHKPNHATLREDVGLFKWGQL